MSPGFDCTVCSMSNDPALSVEMVTSLRGRLMSTVLKTRANILFLSDKLFPNDLSRWIRLIELVHYALFFFYLVIQQTCVMKLILYSYCKQQRAITV